jgi:hypothetical protein
MLSGGLTLDCQALVPNPSAAYTASCETSPQVSVTIVE